jgi:hypothetical protein
MFRARPLGGGRDDPGARPARRLAALQLAGIVATIPPRCALSHTSRGVLQGPSNYRL